MSTLRNLNAASSAILVAMLTLPLACKIIPGPFVSFIGDIIPSLCGMLAIWCALPYRTYPLVKIKASAWAHLAVATAIVGFVVYNVISFWFEPYARRAAFGW